MTITGTATTDAATTHLPAGGYFTAQSKILGSDVNLYYEDAGAGRPVVLIHGWPLSGASWQHQVGALTDAGYRVITYDRRGFGRSDKPNGGYKYDTFAEDLNALLEYLDLNDVTLVGFSMGGGEVARYIGQYGQARLHSVIFASAVTPFLGQTPNNPDGPLEPEQAAKMTADLTADRDAFFTAFANDFYTANGELQVGDAEIASAIALAQQSDQQAALASMAAFGETDFRDDLTRVTIPTLIIQGDADGVVFFEGSGKRTHDAIAGSELVVISGAPHGVNVSNPDEWNSAVLDFLQK